MRSVHRGQPPLALERTVHWCVICGATRAIVSHGQAGRRQGLRACGIRAYGKKRPVMCERACARGKGRRERPAQKNTPQGRAGERKGESGTGARAAPFIGWLPCLPSFCALFLLSPTVRLHRPSLVSLSFPCIYLFRRASLCSAAHADERRPSRVVVCCADLRQLSSARPACQLTCDRS